MQIESKWYPSRRGTHQPKLVWLANPEDSIKAVEVIDNFQLPEDNKITMNTGMYL